MNRKLACALLLSAVAGHAQAGVCFQGGVKQVHVGEINHSYLSDGGMAIYFTTDDNKLLPVDFRYNMNDPQGAFMYKQLALAAVGGYKIIAFDNASQLCDKVNQITLIAG